MEKPNIVVILSDQHNAGVMHCAGDEYIKTPNLDKLAENGILFDNCYSASPLCVPSRSAFLTGQLPSNNKVFINANSIHSTHATIAHSFTNENYETVLAGRMHFIGDDQNHGFETRLLGDVTPFYQGYHFMKQSFEDMYDAFIPSHDGMKKIGAGMTSIYHFDNALVEETRDFLQNRSKERPLFMTIGLSAPHPPFVCEEKDFEYYYNLLPELETSKEFEENSHEALLKYRDMKWMNELESEDIKKIRASYYGLVDNLDENIGRIIQSIEDTIGLENTIIVYTSDHGDHLGKNNMIWKGTFLDDSIKVPMIVSSPFYAKGKTIKTPVSLIDLSKTLLDMGSSKYIPQMDGISFLESLKNGSEPPSHYLHAQIGSYPIGFTPSAMVRKDNYKLIEYHGYDKYSLFDLSIDKNECNDLGGDDRYKDIIDELSKELHGKFDGEKVKRICEAELEHHKILKQWSNNTKYDKKENWSVEPNLNYLK